MIKYDIIKFEWRKGKYIYRQYYRLKTNILKHKGIKNQ